MQCLEDSCTSARQGDGILCQVGSTKMLDNIVCGAVCREVLKMRFKNVFSGSRFYCQLLYWYLTKSICVKLNSNIQLEIEYMKQDEHNSSHDQMKLSSTGTQLEAEIIRACKHASDYTCKVTRSFEVHSLLLVALYKVCLLSLPTP